MLLLASVFVVVAALVVDVRVVVVVVVVVDVRVVAVVVNVVVSGAAARWERSSTLKRNN